MAVQRLLKYCVPLFPSIKVPSKSSRRALAEVDAGKVKHFATVDDLMADLHADD